MSGWNGAVKSVANPGGSPGGTLAMVASADVDSLDPARTYYVWSWLLQRTMHRTLMAFGTDPATPTVVPDLATGPGEVSDSGLTWTYRIRDGVRFETGEVIRAQDVAHAVERIFAQDVLPGGPTYLLDLLDHGDYRGPYGGQRCRAVECPDDHTLRFRLKRPFADFDFLMAQPNTAPVAAHHDTREDYEKAPVCSGPYRIGSYRAGHSLHLVRNPMWDRATDPLRSALPDDMTVTFGVDVNELDRRLMAGEFHIDVEGRGIQHSARDVILADPALRARSDNPATGFLQYITVQTCVPPFDNVHARRAVFYAADKAALLEARGGDGVGGSLATSLIPPTLPSHTGHDRYPSGADLTGDLKAARAELEAAGLPDGFETRIATQPGKFELVARTLADAVARVGIRVHVEVLDTASYYRSGLGHPDTVRALGLGLGVSDWGADYPTEYGFLAPLVDGRQIKPGGGNFNFAELDDPVVRRLVDEAQALDDPEARQRLWQRVEETVMERAVILPIAHDRTLHYRHPDVTDVYVHPAFGLYDIQAMGLAR
ncbi:MULTISPECIES: ABC transporter substrate-binding protein [Streptomyces]|uniref:Peptide ABC transporter substrate-binding protein n=1 Tax=Streptomyces viridochromogenes TaxID=1938 RepID=A0A0L8KPW0_STRVR|nr:MULTISPECIES: ABC transporter substrate-binding protein [Streptomyces]KOG27905.1 peptide ABC transporter substrate-binding protein [Streptomyces viridochromogenes]